MPKKNEMSSKDIIYYYREAKENIERLREQMDEAYANLDDKMEAFLEMRLKVRGTFEVMVGTGMEDEQAYVETGREHGLLPEKVKALLAKEYDLFAPKKNKDIPPMPASGATCL